MALSTESFTCELSENDRIVYLRNFSIGIVNFFNLIVAFGIYSDAVQIGDATCEQSLTFSLVIISAVLTLSSLISIAGLCFGLCFKGYPKWLFWIYMMVISATILMFLIFIVFLFVFTSDSAWMRKTFADDDRRWNKIKTCFSYRHVCKKVYTVYGTTPTLDGFGIMRFSDIQSGCCKPPAECNFEYVSPFQWLKPDSLVNFTNPDCQLWRNDASAFCFDCGSCKDGFTHALMDNWEFEPFICICVLVVMLVLYGIGCVTLFLFASAPSLQRPFTAA